jgi:hypothetical protein
VIGCAVNCLCAESEARGHLGRGKRTELTVAVFMNDALMELRDPDSKVWYHD